MQDYYKNLTEKDLNEVLDLNNLFYVWNTYYNCESKDLYFLGIKRGDNEPKIILPEYVKDYVINTSSNIH